MRATVSAMPPGAYGTMMRIALAGQVCAWLNGDAASVVAATTPIAERRVIGCMGSLREISVLVVASERVDHQRVDAARVQYHAALGKAGAVVTHDHDVGVDAGCEDVDLASVHGAVDRETCAHRM